MIAAQVSPQLKAIGIRARLNDGLGAFADAAILFPLIAILTQKSGFSGVALFATASMAYAAAGFIFKVPMSVQPLKSIAIAGVAMGASFNEIRISAVLLGALCLLTLALKLDRFAERVPRSIIQSVQLGLGCLLIIQGWQAILPFSGLVTFYKTMGLVVLMYFGPRLIAFPFLGLIATAAVAWGVLHPSARAVSLAHSSDAFRFSMIAAIILPQIALTFSNSILGTADVARRYFADRDERVTVRNLLASIGVGNVLTGAVGGLPFCHGSGGLTAHVRGGATTFAMNGVMAAALGLLAVAQYHSGATVVTMPNQVMAALLMTTGLFHLELARSLWRGRNLLSVFRFATSALAMILTRNLLAVLALAIVIEILEQKVLKNETLSRSN